MNKIFSLLIAVMAIVAISCSKEKDSKQKLNEDQFINMLIDIHVADGSLDRKNIYRSGNNYRPSYYYNSIYEKYNITAAEFDSCVYHYTSNPERYTKLYDIVIDSLNRLETQLRRDLKEAKLSQDTINLWKKKLEYNFVGNRKPYLSFSIPVKQDGIYTIQAKYKFYKDDQSEKPYIEAYFWKRDSANKVQKVFFDKVILSKDTIFKEYKLQLKYPDSTYTQLRGNLFLYKEEIPGMIRHFDIKDILIFNPQIKPDTAAIEQSLKRRPELLEEIPY
jgi:hypothetical protein